VPADQAAGLRRRGARHPLRCITCFSDSTDSSVRLAHALHQIGRAPLLIDTQGRLFSTASPRSLFDWKHQLERRQLHTLPQAYGEGWYAPGMRADEPALSGVANGYDYVMFDSGWGATELALLQGAVHALVLEVRRADESMLQAYAVLKTMAGSGEAFSVYLLGDRTACDQVRAAGCHFLGQRFAHAIFTVANEDDAFAALAVRMAGEETSLTAC
jgi:hypothetical protein